ncbi:MAG: helix-turn-helix transcriptional regulator [Cyanobacteria bacterium P01_A01_bin.114]
MIEPPNADYTDRLRALMRSVGVSSFRGLAEQAGVSRWQVDRLRRGQLVEMRVGILLRLAGVLQISLGELLSVFGLTAVGEGGLVAADQADQVEALQKEYGRLQQQMERQAEQLRSQFQSEALQVIESWLTYWPTATKKVQEDDGFQAKNLLPLVKPVEKLVDSWGVAAIATVGDEIPYDPQFHQLIKGTANPGDLVKVSHVGYNHQGKLLHRVKVRQMS